MTFTSREDFELRSVRFLRFSRFRPFFLRLPASTSDFDSAIMGGRGKGNRGGPRGGRGGSKAPAASKASADVHADSSSSANPDGPPASTPTTTTRRRGAARATNADTEEVMLVIAEGQFPLRISFFPV